MKNIWIVYCEIKSNEFPNGAFVECYVPEDHIVAAIDAAKSYFFERKIQIVNIDRCIAYDEDEWDEENDPEQEVTNAIHKVQESKEIQTGIFRIWKED
jgi:hypothetical protein